MKIEIEKYTNKDGITVYIERYLGKKNYAVLTTDERKLTPIVDAINYDQEHDAFAIKDSYKVADRNQHASLYYYIDYEGNPLTPGYTDIIDGFFDVDLNGKNSLNANQWFLDYTIFKGDLGARVDKELEAREKLNRQEIKKMLINKQ